MPLKWTVSKITFDEGRFTKAISEKLKVHMLTSGGLALRALFHLVPVWTGESRGGLQATAEALGLGDLILKSIKPKNKRKRRNEFGKEKSPTSATQGFKKPKRTRKGHMEMVIFNNADGFFYNDKRKTSVSSSPWRFAASFSRQWRVNLKAEIARDPTVPIKNFIVRQREVKVF